MQSAIFSLTCKCGSLDQCFKVTFIIVKTLVQINFYTCCLHVCCFLIKRFGCLSSFVFFLYATIDFSPCNYNPITAFICILSYNVCEMTNTIISYSEHWDSLWLWDPHIHMQNCLSISLTIAPLHILHAWICSAGEIVVSLIDPWVCVLHNNSRYILISIGFIIEKV